MKINCIAIDDEPLALDKISEYVKRIPYLNLIGSFDNAFSGLEFLKQHRVDLIFLDIQMEDLTGIQMLEVMQHKPKIILTTAYDQYAIKSYELDVCDYLLKPISFQRFILACEKVSDQLNNNSSQQPPKAEEFEQEKPEEYFYVKNGHKTQKVNFKDIFYIEGMKDYVRIYTEKEKIMTLLSLKKLEEILPINQFLRIHKSYLISINKIESIERNRVQIMGIPLPLGKSYQKYFFNIIEKFKVN